MAGDAILDFQICEISLADSIWKAQTHHRAKCRRNWSSVVETLQFFKFSKWLPLPSWIFEIAKFYWLLWRRGSRHASMPNFVKIRQSVVKILGLLFLFKMAAAAIFECRIHNILLADHVRKAQTHHCTKFHQNRSFHCSNIAILQILKMVAIAILDFWNREILLAIVVERVQTHQHAKFRQNSSVGCKDIKIFQFFKMAAAAISDFRNREFLFADGIWRTQTHHCTKFVKIGRSVMDIFRFWFLIWKTWNFIYYCGPELLDASACQIL